MIKPGEKVQSKEAIELIEVLQQGLQEESIVFQALQLAKEALELQPPKKPTYYLPEGYIEI